MARETAFGINLGAKSTYLAVLDQGSQTPKLLSKFPSDVVVSHQGDEHTIDPKDCFSSFICLLGRKFDDPFVQKHKGKVEYKIVKAANGDAWVESSNGVQTSPTQLLEILLLKIKGEAERYRKGTHISKFHFTFPCRVFPNQLAETLKAFPRAGVKEVIFLHEFCAAAISNGLDKKKGLFAIIDLGATTLDITLFSAPSGIDAAYNIIGIPQRHFLGGDDFDEAILKYLMNECKRKKEFDQKQKQKLRKVAEGAKIRLSSSLETEINLPNTIIGSSGRSKDQKIILSRTKFESLVSDLCEEIRNLCNDFLKRAHVKAMDVKDTLFLGGMANVPILVSAITDVFGKCPLKGLDNGSDVALGAAMSVEAEQCVGINPLCALL